VPLKDWRFDDVSRAPILLLNPDPHNMASWLRRCNPRSKMTSAYVQS